MNILRDKPFETGKQIVDPKKTLKWEIKKLKQNF